MKRYLGLCVLFGLVGCGPSVQHAGVKTVTEKVNVYRNPDGKMSRTEFNYLTYGTKKITITNHFGNIEDNSLADIDSELDKALTSPDVLVYPERGGSHHFILVFSLYKHDNSTTLVLKGMR